MLVTNRLILRRFSREDMAAIFAMRSDAETMRFIREPQSGEEATWKWLELVSSEWQTETIAFCAVVEQSLNITIGWCGLWRLTESAEIEIGYAFAKDFWKWGYASEAAAAFMKYGFDHLGLDEIVAVANPENQASQSVMKKLGMSYDYTGEFYGHELVHYSILRSDWQAS